MPKSDGYKNLELGRGWNKGMDSSILLYCENCGKSIKSLPSHVKSENAFCSVKCKGIGMTKGMTKPMRLGTGCDEQTRYFKRKYYKYRGWDKIRNHNLPDFDVWDLVKRLRKGKCEYCDSIEKLGLDRTDNKKGHTKDNTVVCCELCNMTRGDRFSFLEMKKIGEVIKNFRN